MTSNHVAWPKGTSVALLGSHVLEIYEPYERLTLGRQVKVRAVDGKWPGLEAVGVGMVHAVTPLARKLLRIAAGRR